SLSPPPADSAFTDSLARATPPPRRRDLLAEVRANFTRENRAYAHTRVVLDFVEPLYAIGLALLLLFSGLSVRMRNVANGLGHRRYVRVLVYFTLFTLLTFVVTLPLSWFEGYALEHQYGLSNQSLGAWITDELKTQGFTLAIFGVIPLIALAYLAIER